MQKWPNQSRCCSGYEFVGPRNHVLDGDWGPDPPCHWGNFEEKRGQPIVNYRDSAVGCAKMAEAIEMLFGIWTRMGSVKHVLDGVHSGTTWQI